MSSFYLEIDALGSFGGGNAPLLEILVGGLVVSSTSVTTSAATYNFTLDYTGNFPSSLSFRFNGSSGDPGDTVSLNAVRVNGQTVDTSNLSTLLITRGGSSNLDTASTDHLFGRTEPSPADLGATTITGTPGIDNINGSNGVTGDVIDAGDGADRVRGLGSDDAINGGLGNDRIFGEGGNDIIIGGAGNDRIFGGDGDDLIHGQDDNDRLIGGNGNDTLNGGNGNDGLIGGAGNDILFGEAGVDFLIGGAGDDTLYGDDGNDNLSGGADNDTLNGGNNNDKLDGGLGDDTLNGDSGQDIIAGGAGADTANGGADNDVIYGEAGADILSGDGGDDEIHGGADGDTLNGGDNTDTLYGDDGADTLNGDAGNDTLYGGDGGDTLNGGDGNDTLFAYEDTLNPQFLSSVIQNDNPVAYWRLNETAGTTADNLGSTGSPVDGTISGGITLGSGILFGSGDTVMDFNGIDGIINIPDSAQINTSSVTERTIELVFEADNVVNQQVLYEEGGTVNSIAIYIEGNNIYFEAVDGGDWGPFSISAPIVTGQVYHAALVLDQPNGTLTGYLDGVSVGSGAVTIPLSAHGGNIYIGGTGDGAVYHDGADGSAGYHFDGRISDVAIYNSVISPADLVTRSDLVQSSTVPPAPVADDGADILNGGDGDDDLYAYGANDTLNGDADNDNLYGNDSINILNGGSGLDTIRGEDGADIIDGGADADTIFGGEGSDTIQGGTGNDTIYGDDISGIVMESGRTSVTQANSTQWHSVTFTSAIQDAVVKMFAEDVAGDPFTLRVRNITETGFEFQLDEFDYQDGSTALETISWIAVASGSHTLENGTQIQAGFVTAENDNTTTVSFEDTSYSNPIVFSQVSSDNELSAVVTRNQSVTSSGFTVSMDEEEANARTHATEDIGWIAIEAGGTAAGGLLSGTTGDNVTDATTTINFGGTFSATPIIIADMQTLDGGDTGYAAGVSVSTTQAQVFIDEEESSDTETAHTTEEVGYLALLEGTYGAFSAGNADQITSGAGADQLYGGAGIDTFIFENATAFSGIDTINDFSTTASDILDLSDLLSAYTFGVDVLTDFVRITDSGPDSIVEVDTDGGADSFVQIATLANITGLTDEVTLETNGVLITT
ncbi:MAG: LamG-like jellyroll fold domain-containing protein [Pseudomonadota bacterium]